MEVREIFSVLNVVKIAGTATISFFVAILLTPIWTKVLYKYQLGKQVIRKETAPIFSEMHKKKVGTPTMGGVVIWMTVVVITVMFWALAKLFPGSVFSELNFLSRAQTWVPLAALIISAIFGLVDDYFGVRRIGPGGGGLKMRDRILMYVLVGAGLAWWFYVKLGWNFVNIPFLGDMVIGWWYVPFFVFIIVASAFSANETDGLDGLAAGIFLTMFVAYGAIAFDQGRVDLVVFMASIIGALIAFLWFNIYPAKFFMGDTGSMSLGVTLGVVAMFTNTPLLLIPIAMIFIVESGSVIIQLTSKKLRGKKIFLSTPIHHHFEALGWHETQVTMRFWMISAIGAIIGLIIFLVDSKIPAMLFK
ncbi:MAG: Phospho-N-acetylmuramoyl-pentapeptide-transferase [Candidatus Yanofskybacteria bacterium GW2011_GWF1_44_227]|uniref:Phospho-N-acetylmuramoyl-pentapeptide-transferase n=1 Tax=Candidatus Yanofskybacteria bacterium GW2011_GWE2_40_11 TaxID=1619033 RepID=A0A0G0QU14_9BACT|nr:MAG: Phospho-N-acetylmuramoyl-pentapeptide-transferase [Candidatus Yanofskybacteria bacterium GW2011_GWE1_40_10]KKR40831.1 MAG: Phospho-N-acetylmuramoyl-pentapeptide-transferase [Candidatus Yanofskybacteria bacterium GW2011_GWE2_40_11]KKT15946.1 MAG: Phospho-N-acetylmuramoyl-pentapeptide-transferase [Candidatus Yanofskybacteria bacterium GW2011_GWF2_43_596]KKT53540.1 MAG: Phospho-N-acetylmuramoyl-pentapeptide-transferase [Candidatus Yanofskybacteria bacterium GW2011_GWF1_44_227]OGN36065.1 MA